MFGGGGFAGDGGAQFAGGGFMPSQAPESNYGGGGGSGGAKKSSNTTLRTLTIRQLAKDLANANDDSLVVDGVELANMCVIGKILSVHDRNNSLVLLVSDGTGELEINHWLQEESEQAMQSKKAEMRPGVYVQAHGSMRTNDKKMSMNAFNIRAVSNFNEVTYHFLRAIFEHLHLTKGAQAAPAAAGGFGGNPVGGFGGAPQQQQQAMGGGATTFAGAGGADSCQSAIMAILQQCQTDTGLHINEVFNKLSGQFSRIQVDQAMQALMSDAHVYTTIDEYHFKFA